MRIDSFGSWRPTLPCDNSDRSKELERCEIGMFLEQLKQVVKEQSGKRDQLIHHHLNNPLSMPNLYVSVAWQSNGTEFAYGRNNEESSCPYFLLGYLFQADVGTKAWVDISMENTQFRLFYSGELMFPVSTRLKIKGIHSFSLCDYKDKNNWRRTGEGIHVYNGNDWRKTDPNPDDKLMIKTKKSTRAMSAWKKNYGNGVPEASVRYSALESAKATDMIQTLKNAVNNEKEKNKVLKGQASGLMVNIGKKT